LLNLIRIATESSAESPMEFSAESHAEFSAESPVEFSAESSTESSVLLTDRLFLCFYYVAT
jgi:hypothetical protein